MLTLQQLITAPTEDEAYASLLTILGQLGFQATSWQRGAIQLTMLRLLARVWSSLSATVLQIAAGGFTTLAGGGTIPNTSAFLRLLAVHVYELTPLEAQPTIGQVLLTSDAAAPVHTFAAGDLIVADQPSGTSGAHTYVNTEGGTLGPGATLSVRFQADPAGAAGNIATGTTLYLWTPLVGVTPTNPAYLALGTWITTPGEDQESDARLASRCIGRFSRLSPNNINGAYEAWAKEALPELTRISVAAAAGNGTITLYGATALGPLTAPQCTTIGDYLSGVTDGKGRRPLNDIVTVSPATTLSSPALNIDAYVTPAIFDTAADTIEAALAAYIGTVPIGGVKLIVGSGGIVPYTKLVQIAQDVPGVRKLVFSISADITLTQSQIYTPTITVTPHMVQPGI